MRILWEDGAVKANGKMAASVSNDADIAPNEGFEEVAAAATQSLQAWLKKKSRNHDE